MFKTKLIKKLALIVAVCSLANVVSFGTAALAVVPAYDGVIHTFNFDDGDLPECFDSEMFTVENGMLKVNDAASSFSFDDLSKNYSVEFRMKPLEGDVEKAFNLHFGNVSFFFDGANGLYGDSGKDRIELNKRINSKVNIKKLWADGGGGRPNGAYFPDRTNGHVLKAVVNDAVHSVYVDGSLIISGECSEEAGSNGVSFSLASFANAGIYLDDIVVKDITVPYAFDFDNGKLPVEFDSTKFVVENGKLKTTATNSSFKLPNVPKNCSFEFKIKPIGTTVPKFSVEFGNAYISYDNLYSRGSGNDIMNMYNRITWGSVIGKSYANGESGITKGSFFPDNTQEYTLKCVSYGDTHSMYINDTKLVFWSNDQCVGEMDSYNVAFTISAEGLYIDDIVVRDSSAPYSYNFNNGKLPSKFDSTMFSVENEMLKVNGANSSFEFKNMSKNCSLEFKIKPFTDKNIPAFYIELGNAQISYKDTWTDPNAASHWNDEMPIYNRVNWDSAQLKKQFADGVAGRPLHQFFSSSDGHTVKYVAKDNMHSVYIDGNLINKGELTGELTTGYNIKFTVGNKATTGFYLDDIQIKLLDYEPEFGAAVSANGDTKTCNVTLKNIDDENKVVFACYKSGKLIDAQVRDCTNDSEVFTSTADIDEVKVMLLSDLSALTPVYDAISIPQSEWAVVTE